MSALTWPKRPKRRKHLNRGRMHLWLANQGCYRVHRLLDYVLPNPFTASIGPSPATGAGQVLGHHSTLRAAQRACERHDRDERAKRLAKPREARSRPRRGSHPSQGKRERAA